MTRATLEAVLVVDDESQIRRALRTNLTVRGYDVIEAATGEQALAAAAEHALGVVLLDLGLPGMSGLEVLARLRQVTDVPVIVLTVRDEESDKVAALDAGADDYVTKPFGMNELLARLRSQIRRATAEGMTPIPPVSNAHFTVDLTAGRVTDDSGRQIHLTPKEWGIVAVLARRAGQLVLHKDLLHTVWGPQYGQEANYLRVYMTQIRRKLEPDPHNPQYFLTEPGLGYRLEATTAPEATRK